MVQETGREVGIEQLVRQTLDKSGLFTKVESNVRMEGSLIDVLATAKPGATPPALAFEIKVRPSADRRVVVEAGRRAELLKTTLPEARLVLLVVGQLTEDARAASEQLGLATLSADGLNAGDAGPALQQLVQSVRMVMGLAPQDPKADQLVQALKAIPPGTPGWVQYQKLACDIFEYLFCPPLDRPRYENPDAVRRNRRDMIFENPCENGFWAGVRRDYLAHYLVVDAKNYAPKIQKKAILEIAYYLKPHGCGMFGVIACRNGLAASGLYATREQWVSSQKMIVVASDADVIQMLRMKAIGNRPEELLRAKIADFRTSL